MKISTQLQNASLALLMTAQCILDKEYDKVEISAQLLRINDMINDARKAYEPDLDDDADDEMKEESIRSSQFEMSREEHIGLL